MEECILLFIVILKQGIADVRETNNGVFQIQ